MKGKYKRNLIYCPSCDKDKVSIGEKCEYCNTRAKAVKIKKPSSRDIFIKDFDQLLVELTDETIIKYKE